MFLRAKSASASAASWKYKTRVLIEKLCLQHIQLDCVAQPLLRVQQGEELHGLGLLPLSQALVDERAEPDRTLLAPCQGAQLCPLLAVSIGTDFQPEIFPLADPELGPELVCQLHLLLLQQPAQCVVQAQVQEWLPKLLFQPCLVLEKLVSLLCNTLIEVLPAPLELLLAMLP